VTPHRREEGEGEGKTQADIGEAHIRAGILTMHPTKALEEDIPVLYQLQSTHHGRVVTTTEMSGRITLLGVDEVGKLCGVTQEEDRSVVADVVPA
jgi:uncharacterized protein YuzE